MTKKDYVKALSYQNEIALKRLSFLRGKEPYVIDGSYAGYKGEEVGHFELTLLENSLIFVKKVLVKKEPEEEVINLEKFLPMININGDNPHFIRYRHIVNTIDDTYLLLNGFELKFKRKLCKENSMALHISRINTEGFYTASLAPEYESYRVLKYFSNPLLPEVIEEAEEYLHSLLKEKTNA